MRLSLPREHGAWAMLLLPLIAALLIARDHGAGRWLVVPVVLFGYAAREPLRHCWRGHAERQEVVWLVAYVVVVSAAAAALISATGRTTWLAAAAVCAVATLISTLPAVHHHARSLAAQLVGALALPLAAVVGTLASAAGSGATLYLLFALYNLTAVTHVRSQLMARHAGRNPRRHPAAHRARLVSLWALITTVLGVAAVSAGQVAPRWVLVAYLPGWSRIVVGYLFGHHPTHSVRRLGWTEMLHAVLFCAVVVAALR